MAVSRAHATWQGDLGHGGGRVSAESGMFSDLPLTWAARTERSAPTATSPEELIAAAHASCYAMALSNTLDQDGHAPDELEVEAEVHFTPQEGGGFRVSRIELSVRGRVPGLTPDRFDELAAEGEKGCPVSNLVRGNADIELKAELA